MRGSWLLLALGGLLWPQPTSAGSYGTLAYGVRVDEQGAFLDVAVELASGLQVDWLAVTFDWAEIQESEGSPADMMRLDVLLLEAEARQIPVLVSISHAPDWAMSARGPSAEALTETILALVAQYPAIHAIELFPGANTMSGWGTTPDPQAYLILFNTVSNAVSLVAPHMRLVAAGLQPLSGETMNGDQDELSFLRSLYEAGGKETITTLSLNFLETMGEPMASPFQAEARVLRRYEIVRQVMLEYGHKDGVVWVTRFSWPSVKPVELGGGFPAPDWQAKWLHEAYNLFNSQLYIETAFFDGLNPSTGDAKNGAGSSLIQPSGELHPGLFNLRQLTSYRGEDSNLAEPQVPVKVHRWDKAHLKAL